MAQTYLENLHDKSNKSTRWIVSKIGHLENIQQDKY